eukprot:TRINITY_DN55125_c0_g1_i1.p1 TRINITY_DN55125_c0_g1~~TRINITY_DN55125_c0_g1_i1.p1  ORF type:complete len:598 (+),score=169.36 TRINITY_DN55125_c0_g1_i1:84-1796(+)
MPERPRGAPEQVGLLGHSPADAESPMLVTPVVPGGGLQDEDDLQIGADAEAAAIQPAGTFSAIFNMVNSILGAGLVGLPYAFARAGVPLGWMLFVGTALLTCYTLEILIHVGDKACREGHIAAVAYEEVTAYALGERGRRAALGCQWLYTFGACVGYVVILKDSLCTALGNLTGASIFEDQEALITAALCLVLLLPICLLRSVASLSNLSLVSFVAVIVIVVLVVEQLATNRDNLCAQPPPAPPAAVSPADLAAAPVTCDVDYSTFGRVGALDVLGVFVFAYMAHHNQFPIYRSLGDTADPKRFASVTRLSILLASMLTGTSSAVIYATYGQSLDSDFFKSYPGSSDLMNAGRFIFALTMVLSFPMQFVVGREVVQVVLADMVREVDLAGATPLDDDAAPGFADAGRSASGVLASGLSTGGAAVRPMASSETLRARSSFGARSSQVRGRVCSSVDRPPPNKAMSAAGGAVREFTPLRLHLLTTLPLFVVIVGLALAAPSLGAVLNLVGGIMGSALGFVIPALINISDARERGTVPLGGWVMAYGTVCFGVCVGVISTVFSVLDFAGVSVD